jgi:GDPmannose 4,6-dehydratase
MAKKALIAGIAGQDGSYLAELLLAKGYEVHGVVRRSSSLRRERLDHLPHADPAHPDSQPLVLHYGDLTDGAGLMRLVEMVQPDEVYNLGAQSHVHVSFDQPEYTAEVNAVGTTRLLEAIRLSGLPARFYQASTSDLFGTAPAPQSEETPFHPRSPYAVAKLYAHWITVNYREAHGMFACSGILFNHESPRRGENFITRKITRGVAEILAERSDHIAMGDLDAGRDWGHARDYVRAMWLMLQQEKAGDYVIGTGQWRSIRELLEVAFGLVGLRWEDHVRVDQAYLRPAETGRLVANPAKAKNQLGWEPTIGFEQMIAEMLNHDLRAAGVEPAGKLVKVAKLTP